MENAVNSAIEKSGTNVTSPKLGVKNHENVDKIPFLFMMMGLPGSGKSSYAESIVLSDGVPKIHSSDALRKELYGDENSQEHNNDIFCELHKRIKEDLRNGVSVVYDATNINKKRRMAFLKELSNIPCHRVCIEVMTPYEQCVEQNNKRERKVPGGAIFRMLKNWQPPSYDEGWNKIVTVFNDITPSTNWTLKTLLDGDCGIDDFEQDNEHHSLTLGKHCRKAMEYIASRRYDRRLQIAALLHDIGKIETKSRLNSKGEDDGNCHYYQHHCVGAYKSMFYTRFMNFTRDDMLYIANLIYYHMHPYMSWRQSESAMKKAKKQLGE